MKTRNYLKICTLITGIALMNTGCKDYLTIDQVENKTIELGYYDSFQKVEQLVLGPYVDLRRALVNNHAWLMYGDVRGGDLQVNLAFSQEVVDQQLKSSNRSITQLSDWTYFYDAINDANKALTVIENSQGKVLNVYQYKLYKGEMLALKSLAYFYLLRIWGPIPSAERSDLGTILTKDQWLSRLTQWTTEAEQLLPWQLLNDDGIINPSMTAVRFNKTAVNLLKADLQLTAGDGPAAKVSLQNVLDPTKQDSLSSFGLSLGKDTDPTIPKDPYTGKSIGLSLAKFNSIYPIGDKRRAKFNLRTDGSGANLIMDEASTLTIYPLREIKLMQAEATWRTGQLELAKTYLKEAAVGATEDYMQLTEKLFPNALLVERQRLLIGLGKRFFDINRFDRLSEIIPYYSVSDVQAGGSYWPLSAKSLQTNGLTQNRYWSK